MESMNLASVWNLPVMFVCKDDGWSITAQSEQMTGGTLNARAQGLGIPVVEVDGLAVAIVWDTARKAIESIRSGKGPIFLHARCVHLEGHFLDYQLLRILRKPLKEMPEITAPLTRSFLSPGGAKLGERFIGLKSVLSTVFSTIRDPRQDKKNDPVTQTRRILQSDTSRLQELEDEIELEISNILTSALEEVRS
jgi:pyruvate dehydrogenase E1 component alpha subunit